jgi:predicted enzyme related to lactoylglutathione lyase
MELIAFVGTADQARSRAFYEGVLGLTVTNIEAALADLDVELLRYEGIDQDERGVWTAPGGIRVAWFRDPDGNVLSLSQHS